MTNNIITIFNKDLSVGVFITFEGEELSYNFFDGFKKENLADFIKFIEKNKPRLRKEVMDEKMRTFTMAFEEVEKSEPLYLAAVSEELRRKGFLVALVSAELKEPLLLLSDKNISQKEREAVIGDLVNLRGKALDTLTDLVRDIKSSVKEIKENRDQWNNFLENKRQELLEKRNKE